MTILRIGLVALLGILGAAIESGSSLAQQWVTLTRPLSPELRDIAEQYFRSDWEWRRLLEPDVEGRIDIDEDIYGALADIGFRAAFLAIENPGWCGSAGCHLIILRKQGKKWHSICGGDLFGDRIKILESKDHGIHRLVIGETLLHRLIVVTEWKSPAGCEIVGDEED
jgi:hypothetical protein